MTRLWFSNPEINQWADEASEAATRATGIRVTTTPTTPISPADQRLPIREASRTCTGCSITASTIDQTNMPAKGSTIRAQA